MNGNGSTRRIFQDEIEQNLKIQNPTKMGQTILITYDAMITKYYVLQNVQRRNTEAFLDGKIMNNSID